MTRILMVCLGNICRSPLAEGILKSKVNPTSCFVDSAGTSGFHRGELPDSRSIQVAQKYGIDITDQRSRPFRSSDFQDFDLIYAMDSSNYHNILKLAQTDTERQKVKLILREIENPEIIDVPDPYYGGEQGFENVFAMLDKSCTLIANKINS